MYDLYAGRFDSNIDEIARGVVVARDIPWLVVDSIGMSALLRELNSILNPFKNVVGTNKDDPPPCCARRHKTMDSVADGDHSVKHELMRERDSVWKQVSEKRRKLPCQIVVTAGSRGNKRAYQDAFDQSPLVDFKGQIGSAHRLFAFSAELTNEAKVRPWGQPFDIGTCATEMISFITEQSALCDVLLFGDGRSRKTRRIVENSVEACRHVSELWLVYMPTARLGRRVHFGSDNKETIHVSMPVPRTQLKVQRRHGRAGETSTFSTTYTG